jgi:hypothetical protein
MPVEAVVGANVRSRSWSGGIEGKVASRRATWQVARQSLAHLHLGLDQISIVPGSSVALVRDVSRDEY